MHNNSARVSHLFVCALLPPLRDDDDLDVDENPSLTSLTKQPTFSNVTAGFPAKTSDGVAKWRLFPAECHLFPSAKLTFSSQWLSQDISLFLHEISVS